MMEQEISEIPSIRFDNVKWKYYASYLENGFRRPGSAPLHIMLNRPRYKIWNFTLYAPNLGSVAVKSRRESRFIHTIQRIPLLALK